MNWTQIDPSPTAEATRLVEPARTSPVANTPGRLSRAYRPASVSSPCSAEISVKGCRVILGEASMRLIR